MAIKEVTIMPKTNRKLYNYLAFKDLDEIVLRCEFINGKYTIYDTKGNICVVFDLTKRTLTYVDTELILLNELILEYDIILGTFKLLDVYKKIYDVNKVELIEMNITKELPQNVICEQRHVYKILIYDLMTIDELYNILSNPPL